MVTVGTTGVLTTTAVQTPQLFASLDSVIVPVEAAEFLSAQARTYQVAAEGNVYDSVAATLPLPASTVAVCVPISVAPVPEASVARWNKLVNPAPVEAAPMFETVAVSVTAAPVVAAVGVTPPAVKSMVAGTVTVTVALAAALPLALLQVIEYVVVTVGLTVAEPDVPDDVKLVPTHPDVALVEDQVSVTGAPAVILVGLAESVAVGGNPPPPPPPPSVFTASAKCENDSAETASTAATMRIFNLIFIEPGIQLNKTANVSNVGRDSVLYPNERQSRRCFIL